MRKITIVLSFLALVLLLATPAYPQTIGDDPAHPLELSRPGPAARGGIAQPDPTPVIPAGPFASNEMQLVGFTDRRFSGDAGLLNMSRACQRMFLHSRMCTLAEVNQSVFIPELPMSGGAWVQHLSDHVGSVPDPDCNGWMSSDTRTQGTSIDLGERYGGLKMQNCDSLLTVACCSREFTVLR